MNDTYNYNQSNMFYDLEQEDYIPFTLKSRPNTDGHFSDIYQLEDSQGRRLIGKILKDEHNEGDYSCYPKLFIQELNALAKLRGHPGVVKLIGAHLPTDSNEAIIVMEKWPMNVSAFNKDNMKSRKLDISQRLVVAEQCVKQIGNTLAFLHQNNYVHNDLKCNNMLMSLDRRGPRFVLADFGKFYKVYDPMMRNHAIDTYSCPWPGLSCIKDEFWVFCVCIMEIIICQHLIRSSGDWSWFLRYTIKRDGFAAIDIEAVLRKYIGDIPINDKLLGVLKDGFSICPVSLSDSLKKNGLWNPEYHQLNISLPPINFNFSLQQQAEAMISKIGNKYKDKLQRNDMIHKYIYTLNRVWSLTGFGDKHQGNEKMQCAMIAYIFVRGYSKSLKLTAPLDDPEFLLNVQKVLLIKMDFHIF